MAPPYGRWHLARPPQIEALVELFSPSFFEEAASLIEANLEDLSDFFGEKMEGSPEGLPIEVGEPSLELPGPELASEDSDPVGVAFCQDFCGLTVPGCPLAGKGNSSFSKKAQDLRNFLPS